MTSSTVLPFHKRRFDDAERQLLGEHGARLSQKYSQPIIPSYCVGEDSDAVEYVQFVRRPTEHEIAQLLIAADDELVETTVTLTGDPRRPFARITASGHVKGEGRDLAALLV